MVSQQPPYTCENEMLIRLKRLHSGVGIFASVSRHLLAVVVGVYSTVLRVQVRPEMAEDQTQSSSICDTL
jgi:hypothetical protein